MATEKRTQPPKAGTRPSIRVDDQLAADLAVVMRTGVNLSDAIRRAVGHLAEQYRTAWAEGVVPVGVAPIMLAYQLLEHPAMAQARPTPTPAPTSGYDARRQPSATPVGRPPAPVAPPSAPAAGGRPTMRRSGPLPGVPVLRP